MQSEQKYLTSCRLQPSVFPVSPDESHWTTTLFTAFILSRGLLMGFGYHLWWLKKWVYLCLRRWCTKQPYLALKYKRFLMISSCNAHRVLYVSVLNPTETTGQTVFVYCISLGACKKELQVAHCFWNTTTTITFCCHRTFIFMTNVHLMHW